ncbi:BTB/POZ domain-containing protein [Rhynchospora pubera]|uniref:BTB/POZ domain-containing protein n=1 Tax=Rhynchospora pubera TaxID=906938 RepID=A0AAV8FDP4_9POAL|nr:BTB/POZ domain-containing protein [Rhynchospora pubera]
MTDVVIQVNEELFHEHSSILGARSPVFKEELSGSVFASKVITIKDKKRKVFKYLLQYIYTDTIDGRNHGIPSSNLARHLLVAANRYGIKGLRIKCEEKLIKDISMNPVWSCFIFGEENNCSKLKEACFKFTTAGTNLAKLVFTEEYLQFMQNYPDLVAELRKRSMLL